MKTEAKQKQSQEDYHIACQHCGTTDQPLHIIPLRNDKHVVGLIHCCDECHDDVKGQPFDKINATQEQDYDFEADVDYVSKKLSDKMWESTKQQQPAVEDKRKEFAIKNKIAVGELICPHCGTIKHGAFDENKCPWCEKPYFATPPTEPAQSEDELLDNIVKIVKSAWTPDSEPTEPAEGESLEGEGGISSIDLQMSEIIDRLVNGLDHVFTTKNALRELYLTPKPSEVTNGRKFYGFHENQYTCPNCEGGADLVYPKNGKSACLDCKLEWTWIAFADS